jgi:hypothetical protein
MGRSRLKYDTKLNVHSSLILACIWEETVSISALSPAILAFLVGSLILPKEMLKQYLEIGHKLFLPKPSPMLHHNMYRIWGSYSGRHEYCHLLGYSRVVRMKTEVSEVTRPPVANWFLARLILYSEDGDDTFLRNIDSHTKKTNSGALVR